MMTTETPSPSGFLTRFFFSLYRLYSYYLDRLSVYIKLRWLFFTSLLALFFFRIVLLDGYYIVAYALSLYLLSLFLAFISPQVDPESEGYVLPVRDAEEFRPFLRRLPEFKFWYSGIKAIVLALTCTFFKFIDLPVFWPLLALYFILLVILTMKEQIKRMIRYKYVPFSWGKQSYGDITRGNNKSVVGRNASTPTLEKEAHKPSGPTPMAEKASQAVSSSKWNPVQSNYSNLKHTGYNSASNYHAYPAASRFYTSSAHSAASTVPS